jgi:hypothetical protein
MDKKITLLLLALADVVEIDEVGEDSIAYKTTGIVECFSWHSALTGENWAWDVNKAKRLVNREENEIVGLHLELSGLTQLARNGSVEIDGSKICTARIPALETPILICPMADGSGTHICIDGWHRIALADVMDLPELPAIILTAEQERECRIQGGDVNKWVSDARPN